MDKCPNCDSLLRIGSAYDDTGEPVLLCVNKGCNSFTGLDLGNPRIVVTEDPNEQ